MFGQNPCSILVDICLLSLSPPTYLPTHPPTLTWSDMPELFAGNSSWKRENLFPFVISLHFTTHDSVFVCLKIIMSFLFVQLCDCDFSLHAPPNSRTWGAVCDKYAPAYAQTDNNQPLPSSLPSRAQMHYHLLLVVTENGKAVDKFNIFSG